MTGGSERVRERKRVERGRRRTRDDDIAQTEHRETGGSSERWIFGEEKLRTRGGREKDD